MAFMFESSLMMGVSAWAMRSSAVQRDYWRAWSGLAAQFHC
jgi:homogentisate 1,2-dioxygenase